MKLHHHTVLSLVSSGAVYVLSRSRTAALACFLSGIFIDLDHLFEYYYYFGRRRLSVREFFRAADEHIYNKFFLFLHSYELAAVLWILSLAVLRRPWAWGFSLGFALHIIADHLYNPCAPGTYLLFFRIRHRFDGGRLFPREIRERYRARRHPRNGGAPPPPAG
ncbi:MAG: hypothetical protein V1789_08645 [PVC group bacterium]